jgi:hypothetical protein
MVSEADPLRSLICFLDREIDQLVKKFDRNIWEQEHMEINIRLFHRSTEKKMLG